MPNKPRPPFIFQGFQSPNTTPMPDEFFDHLLHRLSGAEVKVVSYIARRTFGFKKRSDAISLSQLVSGIRRTDGRILDHGTGLSKATVARAINHLVAMRVVLKNRNTSRKDGDLATTYSLRIRPVSQNETPPVLKMGHPRVSKLNTQETDQQQTVNDTVNVNGDQKSTKHPLRQLPDLGQPTERAEVVASDILDQLGDKHSLNFYRMVARKVPESTVRRVLSEIRHDGSEKPARAFTYRMKLYALKQQQARLATLKASIGATAGYHATPTHPAP